MTNKKQATATATANTTATATANTKATATATANTGVLRFAQDDGENLSWQWQNTGSDIISIYRLILRGRA